jgi:predicted Zn finger-like uncharacterized protein
MNVSCLKCNAVFRVDPERIPAGGVLTRCALCRETFEIAAQEDGVGAPASHAPEADASDAQPAATPEAEPEDVPEPEPVAQADGEPAAVGEPAEADEADEAAEAEPTSRESDSSREELAPPLLPSSPPEPAQPVQPVRPVQPVQPVQPVATPGGAGAPSPFGAADPDTKARRLARALMSDIVMYHPERRDRALREGTLRKEFREEITKSWEEYVEQVGAERARRTPHFRDALNDILARGEKVF